MVFFIFSARKNQIIASSQSTEAVFRHHGDDSPEENRFLTLTAVPLKHN
jgi:hypothetical protein